MLYGQTNNSIDPEYSPDSLNVEALHGLKALDAAAGGGRMVKDLRALGIDIEGFDIKYLRFLSRKPPPGMFGADVTEVPRPDKSYDVIFCTQSVFTYDTSKKLQGAGFAELRRMLKPDGVIKMSPVDTKRIHQLLADFPDMEIKFHRELKGGKELQPFTKELLRGDERAEVVIGFKNSVVPKPAAAKPLTLEAKLDVIRKLHGGKLYPLRRQADAITTDEWAAIIGNEKREVTIKSMDGGTMRGTFEGVEPGSPPVAMFRARGLARRPELRRIAANRVEEIHHP